MALIWHTALRPDTKISSTGIGSNGTYDYQVVVIKKKPMAYVLSLSKRVLNLLVGVGFHGVINYPKKIWNI